MQDARCLAFNLSMSNPYHYDELSTINRCGFSVLPNEKYIEWAMSIDDDAEAHASVLEAKEGRVFLFDGEPINPEQVRQCMQSHYQSIANEWFGSWHRIKAGWPRIGSLEDFEQYFDWSFSEMVFDLSPMEPLEELEGF